MLNTNDILESIRMISDENLDVRTVTMGSSLLDCADPDPKKACEKIYNKITTKAKDLVKTAVAELLQEPVFHGFADLDIRLGLLIMQLSDAQLAQQLRIFRCSDPYSHEEYFLSSSSS